MAKTILTDAMIVINSVDLSDHASQVSIETSADDVDLTSFGATNKEHGRGLGDASITVTFFQDFAAGEVDATLWPLMQSGASFPVAVRPDNGAISATNPEYQMTAVLLSYSPIDGSVGDASTTDVQFVNASQTGLVRDVTP